MCRLAVGDGEAVLAAIDAWRPTTLFLDFDLTLCSTKGGADPLAPGSAHTVDAELHAAADLIARQGDGQSDGQRGDRSGDRSGGGGVHVVTRNRHTRQIRSFLEERGVPLAAVHSTPRGEPKAAYMAATLGGGERAVFVDDSAGEVGEARVRADPRIFRVLMQR